MFNLATKQNYFLPVHEGIFCASICQFRPPQKANASKHDIAHSTWYMKVEKVVVSEKMKEKNIPGVKIISKNIAEEVLKLKQQGTGEIIMFGSPGLAGFLIREDLIDEYWIFINPVIIGNGIPLFKGTQHDIRLKLQKTYSFTNGVTGMLYTHEAVAHF
jgi:dihydrofolate reductase